MTLVAFMARYRAYQRVFDTETMLKANNTTYARVEAKQQAEEEWL